MMVHSISQHLHTLQEQLNQSSDLQPGDVQTLIKEFSESVKQAEADWQKRNQQLEQKFLQQTLQMQQLEAELEKEKSRNRRQYQTLVQNEAKLQAMVKYSPDLITIIESDGSVRYHNPAIERILGYKPEDRINQFFADLIHPDDLPKVQAYLIELLNTSGLGKPIEYRQRRIDGSWVEMEAIGNSVLQDASLNGILLNSRPIASRPPVTPPPEPEGLETALHQLVPMMPVAMVGIDANGQVILWNPAAQDLFGWEASEVMGQELPIIPKNKLDEFKLTLAAEFNGQNKRGLTVHCIHKDNSLIGVCYWSTPLRDANLMITGILRVYKPADDQPFWAQYVKPAKHPARG